MADGSAADCLLAVLAKAPVPGRVKTRMMPDLTAEQCAALQAACLADVVRRPFPADRRVLWITGGESEMWQEAAALGWEVAQQPEGDLGVKMCAAIDEGLTRSPRVLILGTDAPDLPPTLLEQAFTALRTYDAVVIPAADGGYVAVGASRRVPSLFEGGGWGGPTVLAAARQRAAAAGLRLAEVGAWQDLDNVADLRRLALDSAVRGRGPTPYRPESTLALLRDLGFETG